MTTVEPTWKTIIVPISHLYDVFGAYLQHIEAIQEHEEFFAVSLGFIPNEEDKTVEFAFATTQKETIN